MVLTLPPDHMWDYAEATEVGIKTIAGNTEVDIVTWDEPNGFTITCHDISVELA